MPRAPSVALAPGPGRGGCAAAAGSRTHLDVVSVHYHKNAEAVETHGQRFTNVSLVLFLFYRFYES